VTGSPLYDVFISYARADDESGWVTGLRDAIYQDFRAFSSEPFKIFFDTEEIRSRQDWELRLRQGLRSSRVLLICLSPNYLKSPYCRWEFEEFTRVQAQRVGGGDPVTGVYFVGLSGGEPYDAEIAAWRGQHQVERPQLEDLKPWFPVGVQALQEAEVRARIAELGQGVHEALVQERLAQQAPGNLRRHNPWFVGRIREMRELRHQLVGGTVGVVTAVHGIGGMGKTELAITYAHSFAGDYQGGTWYVDADGHKDVLEAISTLEKYPELDLTVTAEQRADPRWLGRLVLKRLDEWVAVARAKDPDTAACLLLLDNVSELELLSGSQLRNIRREKWLHLLATTRLGDGDVGAVGSKAPVAMLPISPLNAEDALELIREHQPARDQARLFPEFSSPAEESAARQIVALLDGYTLAIEQAAVHLGVTRTEPSELLAYLHASGSAAMDEAVRDDESDPADTTGATVRGQILHQGRMIGVIVDQTLQQLTARARAALSFAALLPADAIPWDWLRELTTPAEQPLARTGLPGRPGNDWAATRRALQGRRILTPDDDPRLARLHRVIQDHLRAKLVTVDTEHRLDTHLQEVARQLHEVETPDTTLLAVATATLTSRLGEGRDGLADSALSLIDSVKEHLTLASTDKLAAATLNTYSTLVRAEADNTDYQRGLAASLSIVGAVLGAQGNGDTALAAYSDALDITDRLARVNPDSVRFQHDLWANLNKVGAVRRELGDSDGTLEAYSRALDISSRLADAADADNAPYLDNVAATSQGLGDLYVARGLPEAALDAYKPAVHAIAGRTQIDPTSPRHQRDLVSILLKVGRASAMGGDADIALEAYRRARELGEGLLRVAPDNPAYQRDMASILRHVGELKFACGDTQAALEACTDALNITERLVRTDPDNAVFQLDLGLILDEVGKAQFELGDVDAAQETSARAIELLTPLVRADPENW
jgi:tetratricopeptide (TPR) repeat protein